MNELETTKKLMDDREAAARLGVKPQTLRRWRLMGTGPRFIKLGATLIRYRESDLDSYVEDHICQSTRDADLLRA